MTNTQLTSHSQKKIAWEVDENRVVLYIYHYDYLHPETKSNDNNVYSINIYNDLAMFIVLNRYK